MPGMARHIVRTIASGLMLLAILILSSPQPPFEPAGHAASHAAFHHVMVTSAAGQVQQQCPDQCDFDGHGPACCVTACTLALASLPPSINNSVLPRFAAVSYRAAVISHLTGLAPNPAQRPPEQLA